MSSVIQNSERTDATCPYVDTPPPAPPPAAWSTRLDAHRRRLAEVEATLTARVAQLTAATAEARAGAAAARASLEAELEAELAEIEARLARGAISDFSDALARWYAEPTRAQIRAMSERWREFRAAVANELAGEPSHLVLSVVAAVGLGRELPQTWGRHGAGSAGSSYVGDVASALAAAFTAGDSAAADQAADRLCQLTREQPPAFNVSIDSVRGFCTRAGFAGARSLA